MRGAATRGSGTVGIQGASGRGRVGKARGSGGVCGRRGGRRGGALADTHSD
jgi:hypothetical protein